MQDKLQYLQQMCYSRDMPRVSVPIDEQLKFQVAETPDVFGLDDRLSEARRLALILAAGADALRREVADARRRELYAELIADPGYRESTEELSEVARDHGML